MQDIHIFIFKDGAMKGVDVSLKYLKLTALAKCVQCISHGNSDSERGFSLNKTLLCVHRASIGEETIEAVRFVKNVIIRNRGLANIQVPHSLIRSSQNARQWYESYLVEKRRLEEEEKEKNQEKDSWISAKRAWENKQIECDIDQLKAGLEVAEQSVIEGNNDFAKSLKSWSLDRKEIVCVQSKINMGVKRKIEFNREIIEL